MEVWEEYYHISTSISSCRCDLDADGFVDEEEFVKSQVRLDVNPGCVWM